MNANDLEKSASGVVRPKAHWNRWKREWWRGQGGNHPATLWRNSYGEELRDEVIPVGGSGAVGKYFKDGR